MPLPIPARLPLRAAGALLLALAASAPALAADPALGRTKAQAACAMCHGPLGMGQMPDVPHLAGQPQIYLAQQLRAFRSGARRHEVMNVIAKPLGDEDIEHLAAWFASLKVEARAPD